MEETSPREKLWKHPEPKPEENHPPETPNFLPPPPAQETLSEAAQIPEAPQRPAQAEPAAEAKPPFLPSSVDDFVKTLGNFGQRASLNAEAAKMAQDAMRKAKENKN